jgi:hypothetical protein
MNLARIAENLDVRNLAHFDGEVEALCPNGNSDGDNGQPAISALRTGLETLEAGTLQLPGWLKSPKLFGLDLLAPMTVPADGTTANGSEFIRTNKSTASRGARPLPDVPEGIRTRPDDNLARRTG